MKKPFLSIVALFSVFLANAQFAPSPNQYLSLQNNTHGCRRLFYVDSLINRVDSMRILRLSGSGNMLYISPRNALYKGTAVMSFNGRSGNVMPDSGDYNTTQVPEGTNLYFTNLRFDSRFSSKTTTDLPEGGNLYYTDGRFDTRFSTKTTTDLVEGANLYWTSARFNTAFSGKTTTDLAEGSNLYWTTARFSSAFSGKSTTDLAEGTHLYWTAGRFDARFQTKTTDSLTEGVNRLYFTQGRARNSLSAGSGISYNSGTGVIANASPDQTVTLTGSGITVTGTYPNFTLTASSLSPTVTDNVSRTLNSNFTISTTQWADVSYSITCSVTNPLLAGSSTATAFLEYSTDGGTNWITVSQTGNSSSVGVAVAISITNAQTTILTGVFPPNSLQRIRSVVTGTGSVTYVRGQEKTY